MTRIERRDFARALLIAFALLAAGLAVLA